MRAASVAHPGYQVLSDILFRLGLIMLSHSAVLRLFRLIGQFTPVLALYDPFGVDVPI